MNTGDPFGVTAGRRPMIDVVQALDLLKACAEETAGTATHERGTGRGPRRRPTLASRALARLQLDVTALIRAPGGTSPAHLAACDDAALTLGAQIVFRTALRFGRAGASTDRTLDAAYRAAQRYVELLPGCLHDRADISSIAARSSAPHTSAPRPNGHRRCISGSLT